LRTTGLKRSPAGFARIFKCSPHSAHPSPITYHDASKGLRLSPPNTIHQVTQALEQITAEDAAAHRPFFAAMVISKWHGGLPAPSFFDCATRLGRFAGDATGTGARVFHTAKFSAAVALWAPPGESRNGE
jgi:hypothetical protein